MKKLFALLSLFPLAAVAAPETTTSPEAINTIWVMTASALIFLMQAGFAFLEGGMVRSKNTVNVIMKNFMDSCYSGIVYWIVGFGIMFGSKVTQAMIPPAFLFFAILLVLGGITYMFAQETKGRSLDSI